MASGIRQPTRVVERPMPEQGEESVANSHPQLSPGDRKVPGGLFVPPQHRRGCTASRSICARLPRSGSWTAGASVVARCFSPRERCTHVQHAG